MFKATRVSLFVIAILLTPNFAQAIECRETGYTVIFTNGIFTDRVKAESDFSILKRVFAEKSNLQDVTFRLGYNPSHLAGLGDAVQVMSQALGSSISSFDLQTILMQIHPEVTTQKILLVGHSQGTFYTNELYTYLIQHGVPEKSIAVYNVATPANMVAGGGNYLTSANDNLITRVREWTAGTGANQPLPSNILIPLSRPEADELWRGHSFSGEYLAGASGKVVSNIVTALGGLSAGQPSGGDEGCFELPPTTMSYKTQKAVFAVADPFARVTRDTTVTAGTAVAAASSKMVTSATAATNTVYSAARDFASSIQRKSKGDFSAGNNLSAVSSAVAVSRDPAIDEFVARVKLAQAKSISATAVAVAVAPQVQQKQAPQETAQSPAVFEEPVPTTPSNTLPANAPTVPDPFPLGVPYVGFGGDSGAYAEALEREREAAEPEPEEESEPVYLGITSPSNNSLFGTTEVTFSGTSTPLLVISQNFSGDTTTADEDGDWELTLSGLPEGQTTIEFTASDAEGLSSSPSEISIEVDTTGPTVDSFEILQCTYSLRSDGCLSGSTTVNASWSSSAEDISYYEIVVDDEVVATTTETSYASELSDGSTSALSVVAYDTLGNSATSSSIDVEIFEMPMVINEIAWAGTVADSSDEWIELFNRTSYTIDLSRVEIIAADGTPQATLVGSVSSEGYYLVERTASTTTSVVEDLVAPFGALGNAGEELSLVQSLGESVNVTLDATPTVVSCSGWCAGNNNTPPHSMERKDPDSAGTDTTNWGNNIGVVVSTTDALGNAISGTPGSKNSWLLFPPPPPGGGI